MRQLHITYNRLQLGLMMLFARLTSKSAKPVSNNLADSKTKPELPLPNPALPDCGVNDIPGVTIQEFCDVVARYKHTHLHAITAFAKGLEIAKAPEPPIDGDYTDARSCWYSLERLKKYICLIEQYSDGLRGVNKQNLGIRFYYGTYPGIPDGLYQPAYKGCHSIYLVPTFKQGETNVDFDPKISAESPNKTPVIIGDLINTDAWERALFLLGNSIKNRNEYGLVNNHAELCPPPVPPRQTCDAGRTLNAVDGRVSYKGFR